MLEIMQGDSYRLPMRIKIDGVSIASDDVDELQISIGNITKTYPDEITFDGRWNLHLEQAETYQLTPGENSCHIRAVIKAGDTIDTDVEPVMVFKSISKEVL